jgi:8-oxo-dGTP pyrophosphatase MutT (NUDIX family)
MKPDFVVIVPIDRDRIYLVEQYRYPVAGRYWELPQGSWEDEPDKSPLDLAKAELKEETGLSADHLEHIGHLFEAYGYSNQGFNIFVATDLTEGEQTPDPGELGMICKSFSFSEVKAMIVAGHIKDAATLAVLGMMHIKGLLPVSMGSR